MAAAAAAAGAWAIKFQSYKAGAISSRHSPKYWSDDVGTTTQYEAFKLSDQLAYSDYAEVAAACQERGILFFATPFDEQAISALEDMDVALYKVASADVTNEPLLRAIADAEAGTSLYWCIQLAGDRASDGLDRCNSEYDCAACMHPDLPDPGSRRELRSH